MNYDKPGIPKGKRKITYITILEWWIQKYPQKVYEDFKWNIKYSKIKKWVYEKKN